GDNYFNIGDFENARLQYQKVIDILVLPGDTSAVTPIHGIMKCIIRQDDMKRAAEFADAYVKRFQGTYLSDRITMLKADMFYYSGDVEKAEKEYDKVEHKKLKPAALYYQAQSLQSLKNLVETEKKLREIIDKYPNSKMVSKAALLLGKVLYEERKYSESLKFFEKRKTLKTDEDFEVAYLKGHVYLKLNYKEKAIKTLQGLSDAAKGKWEGKALLLLGDIMVADNNYSKALLYYDKAVKTGESIVIAEAYYKKGKALSKQGKNKEALKTFLKIKYNLPESPFSTRAIYEAAEIALKLGKQQDALSLYKEVIERNDDKKLTIRAKDRIKTLNP
ncbi:MAG: tetratricopeptide repeat protein, partial [Candidatus Cloacimonadota bacterium]